MRGYIYTIASVMVMVISLLLNSFFISDVPIMLASLINVIVVLIVLAIKRIKLNDSYFNLGEFSEYKNKIIIMSLLNLIGIIFMFLSVSLVDPSTYSFITRISVVFSLFIGIFYLKEKQKISVSRIIILLIGVFVMEYSKVDATSILGILFIFVFCLAFSFSNAIAKQINSLSSDKLLYYNNVIAFVPLMIYFVLSDIELNNINAIIALSISAFFSAYLGMYFYYKALEYLDFTIVTAVRTLNPVIVLIVGDVILKFSTPTFGKVFGGLLILIGVGLLINKNIDKKKML